MNALVKTGIVLALLSMSGMATAQQIVDAHASRGPYGEPCAGVYVYEIAPGYNVVCAGKGIVTPDPIDCPVYIDNSWTGVKLCL